MAESYFKIDIIIFLVVDIVKEFASELISRVLHDGQTFKCKNPS